MQEIELKPSTSLASSSPNHPLASHATTSYCLSAFRRSASSRLSGSKRPTRILESNTNPLDRALEMLIFREILLCKSLTHIANNLCRDGLYNNAARDPEAYAYILSGRPRITAEDLLCHVLWRIEKSAWWEESWESALFGDRGKEGLAWALCEAEWRERGCGLKDIGGDGSRCEHGRKMTSGGCLGGCGCRLW